MMREMRLVALLVMLVATPAMASMVLVDNFEAYSDGLSLKNVNGWGNTWNSGSQVDANDPENILVRDAGNTNLLVVSDRDATPKGGTLELGNSGAGLAIPEITDVGTIYMKIKIPDISLLSVATNGLDPTFCEGGASSGCNGVHDWSMQASILQFDSANKTGPDYAFRARDGGAYVDSPTSTYQAEVWYELWIQLDVVNQYARYYMRELGSIDLPTPMLDAGGEKDWGFRNLSYDSLTTLKFNISPAMVWNCDNVPDGVDDPAVDNCLYYEVLIDDIGVSTDAMSFCTVPEPASFGLLALGSILVYRRH